MSSALPELRPQPFRIMIVDDLVGDGPAPEHPVAVAPSGLDDAIAALRVRLALEVPNQLASKPRELAVELRFERLRDFRSGRLAAQVPELAAVGRLRERLVDLRAGRTSVADVERGLDEVAGFDRLGPALASAFGAPPAGASPTTRDSDVPVDGEQQLGRALLDELLGGEHEAPPPAPRTNDASAIDDAIANVGRRADADAGDVARALELVDDLVAAQLREIRAAPRFVALERAWRSLQFLLQHVGTDRSPVRVELCAATPESFAERFDALVVGPEMRGETPAALALTVVGWPFHNRVPELETVRAAWQQSEAVQAPLLWSMADSFLGAEGLAALAGRDSLASVLEGDELTKWRGARADDAARWSGACLNPFVLRAADDGTVAMFGMPSYFVAALVARSVAERGWPSGFAGVRAGAIAGLPVVRGRAVAAAFTEANVRDLADAGILALAAVQGRDEALLWSAPSSHAPARFGNRDRENRESRLRSTLAYQLVAARIAETTLAHQAALLFDGETRRPDDEVAGRFEAFFRALLSDTGSGAGADVRVERESDRAELHCEVRVGDAVLDGAIIEFALPLD